MSWVVIQPETLKQEDWRESILWAGITQEKQVAVRGHKTGQDKGLGWLYGVSLQSMKAPLEAVIQKGVQEGLKQLLA